MRILGFTAAKEKLENSYNFMQILKNKISIITGGSSGIGKAIALKFSKEGARVVIASRDQEKAKKILLEIPNSIFIKTDITIEADVKNLVKNVIEKFGKIDIVINNAGVALIEKNVDEIPTEDFLEIMTTNFTGTFFVSKYTIPYLLKTKGTIINIGSTAGFKPDPDVPIYCCSKAAVIMFTKAIALKYAKDNIRINCICPGPIDTQILRKFFTNEKELHDYYRNEHPMERIGKPEDVANLALFLASNKNSYINGSIHTIDGGWSLI